MDKTTNTDGWTLMNTSITRTTRHGYSNTCTLANAMHNRTHNQLTNLGRCFGLLGMAIGMNTNTIPDGTRCRLPDGTIATVYRHRRMGASWDGTYLAMQGRRRDIGWRREQLEVV